MLVLLQLVEDHHTTSSKLVKDQMEAEERVKALEMEVEEKKREVEAGKHGMDGLKEKVLGLEAVVKETEGARLGDGCDDEAWSRWLTILSGRRNTSLLWVSFPSVAWVYQRGSMPWNWPRRMPGLRARTSPGSSPLWRTRSAGSMTSVPS